MMNYSINTKPQYELPQKRWLSSGIFFKKFRYSFLNLHFLWSLVIKDADYDVILGTSSKKQSKSEKYRPYLLKIFRFWPRVYEAVNWLEGDIGKHGCDPSDFRLMDPHSHELIKSVVERSQTHDKNILDLGCNCGRFLNELSNAGFTNLYGVDISKKALDYMKEWFPSLDAAHISHDFFQRYLLQCKDGMFDIVYSRGATVELVHPSFPLVKELCRVSQRYVILLINENWNRYPRFWEYEFMKHGFLPVEIIRPITQLIKDETQQSGHNLTLMVFQRAE